MVEEHEAETGRNEASHERKSKHKGKQGLQCFQVIISYVIISCAINSNVVSISRVITPCVMKSLLIARDGIVCGEFACDDMIRDDRGTAWSSTFFQILKHSTCYKSKSDASRAAYLLLNST